MPVLAQGVIDLDSVQFVRTAAESWAPLLAGLAAGLALTLQNLDRSTEAIPHAALALEESLAIRRRVFGSEHPAVLEGLNSLASAFEDAARFEEALAVRREAMPIARRILPPVNDSLAVQVNNVAGVAFRLGRFEEVVGGFQEEAAIWRVTAGEKSTRVAAVRNNLGFALLELGRPEEAKREVAAALAIREERLGAGSPLTEEVRKELARGGGSVR